MPQWSTRFESHPQFGQAVRFATGRPVWVLRATGVVAVLVFIVPVMVAAVLLAAAFAVTAFAWVVFSAVANVLDALTGRGNAMQSATPSQPSADGEDGRENVRVIQRP